MYTPGDVGPRWDPEHEYQRALEYVNDLNANAVHGETGIYPTVGDFVRLRPTRKRCSLGFPNHLSHAGKGIVSTNYKTCDRGYCPTCAAGYALRYVKKALHSVWDGEPLVRAVFTSDEEFRCTQRGKRLARQYKGQILRVLHGYNGEVWIFFPGGPDEGDPVDDVAIEIADAILSAPAYAKGKKRYSSPKTPPKDDESESDESAAEADPDTKWKQVALPLFVPLELADELAPGHRLETTNAKVDGVPLANLLTERVTGRPVLETMPLFRRKHTVSFTLTGLDRETVYAVREVLQPLADYARAEQRQRREEWRERQRIERELEANPPRW